MTSVSKMALTAGIFAAMFITGRGTAAAAKPATAATTSTVLSDTPAARRATRRADRKPNKSQWQDVASWPDPIKPYVDQFMRDQANAAIEPTGLNRLDYIKLAADNVDFWKQHQNADGAIIDPYRKEEWQYSTPCFALAAAAAIEFLDRDDLLQPAAKAMDWACLTLSQGRAANDHGDFYAPVLAHALPLLKPYVPAEQSARWEANIRSIDPYVVYRSNPGRGNWNIVALTGEYLFHKMGLRDNIAYVEDSLAGQGETFGSPFGLYLEGPMAYDHFPRLWAADMVAHGYDGKHSNELTEVLRRAALTSLFLQSPWGELPLGHRSAHHQWNEAEQCVTYEIYGAAALRDGQPKIAGAFKRAAHLALASMKRWQRPSGELWIVKNKVDPSEFHGFEGYSAHSQYNLLPMAMLVMAFEHSKTTEDIKELPAPCDVGGYVLHLEKLHKIIANASGTYIEIESDANLKYDTTGLVRVHFKGSNPQLGPSDVLTTHTSYTLPDQERVAAAIGPAWKDEQGNWRSLAEMGNGVAKTTVSQIQATPERVSFTVSYSGDFKGPSQIQQQFTLTPGDVIVVNKLIGYNGAARLEWPILATNGKDTTKISTEKTSVTVALDGSAQAFSTPRANSFTLSQKTYPNRNGWAHLARAEYNLTADDNSMTLKIIQLN